MDWTPIIIAAIAASPGLIVALLGWRATRVVHTIVNHQRDVMLAKIAALEATLKAVVESKGK